MIWMTTGLSCDGDSVAMTSATNPSLEDIVQGVIPGMPRVVVHNPVLAYEVMRGYHGLVLVDVSRQGGEPGTLYVMEPDEEEIEGGSPTAR